MRIPNGAKDFTVQGMDTMNGGKHGIFREHNCMLLYLCNIFHCIVKRFSPINGCGHG